MNIIYWIIFGALVGWLASILTHNNRRMGTFLNIVVGLVGSMIGGWISSIVGSGGFTIFTWEGLVFSVLGAVVLLGVVNLLRNGRR
jgi:uncharacterized membrane protein YeaQ/YmgE (transglycosylase-associated protein family)